jgi:ring-1,2-phenylacetyl-CoA epoxidase subunit PaaC
MNASLDTLLRLGDDQLVLGHRLSEWCGHAPILEEELALANVALDCLGQAAAFLGLAGQRDGRGRDADALAYFRDPTEFRNCLLVEQENGDFARTIVRQVLFDLAALPELERLASGEDAELAEIAASAAKEARYHRRHAREWFVRLGDGSDESRRRMQRALDELWPKPSICARATPRRARAGARVERLIARPRWSGRDPRSRLGGRAAAQPASITFSEMQSWRGRPGASGVHAESKTWCASPTRSPRRPEGDG